MGLFQLVLPWWVRPLAILLVAVSLYGLGRLHQAQADETARNKATIDHWEEGDKHVARYISRTAELADSLVVADRLVRLCRGQLRSARHAPAAATANPADPGADGETGIRQLGRELNDVQRNRFQCEALIDTVKPQVYNTSSWWEFWK